MNKINFRVCRVGWFLLGMMGLGTTLHAAEPIKLAVIEAFSGPMGHTGQAVLRNLQFAVDRVNQRGGVPIAGELRPLLLETYDSKGQVEEALLQLRIASDRDVRFVLQGNSSAVASALVEAVNRHNERVPSAKMVFLNYSAVDPALTNERCSPWHFRFDAHVEMRMNALGELIRLDPRVRKVYLIGQDYSFGHEVLRSARAMLARKRPDIAIVGEDLHPIGKVRDFSPYVSKALLAGADTVITGNWGNDLTLLVKSARDAGKQLNFYTFYGNSLGAPAAIGDAGVGRVFAVSEWHPNAGGGADSVYQAYRQQFPDNQSDYFNVRNVILIDMLVAAIEKARGLEAAKVAQALAGMTQVANGLSVRMRASDHQLLLPLHVSTMAAVGSAGVARGVEGAPFGFKTALYLDAEQAALPTSCQMKKF